MGVMQVSIATQFAFINGLSDREFAAPNTDRVPCRVDPWAIKGSVLDSRREVLLAAVFIAILMMVGIAGALPDWISVNGDQITFTTNTGNSIVYSNGHLTDFFHNGVSYGGLAGGNHDSRGYKLIEGYYFGPNQSYIGECHDSSADFGGIVYADDSVAVIQAGCTHTPFDQELWRYVIPRNQSGFYDMERKKLTGYLEANNDQDVQFLNTSVLNLYFSDTNGGITPEGGYGRLFTQFSAPGTPFSWVGGYDPVQNATLGWIITGSDSVGRTAHRRYPVLMTEQQLDFAGAGEGDTTQMPLGSTWMETWNGIVSGDASSLNRQALSLVGNTIDEKITPFFSAAIGEGVDIETGALAYQPNPYLNYDIPYGSGNLEYLNEYPLVNGISADTGPDVTYYEDPWNFTYRNPDVQSAWMNYSIGGGSYQITNKRTAYRDADGLIWTYNVTAQQAGNMTFSIQYGGSPSYTSSFTSTTFSEETMDPVDGDYGITFIFPEPITVTTAGYTSTVTLNTRSMNPGDTASYTIYAIPHPMNIPASVETFHTRQKTSLKIPYRVLQPGLQWMPTDTVTAYDSSTTGSGFTVSAFAEAGTNPIQLYSPSKILSVTTNNGTISWSRSADGTITAQWTVANPTVGTIILSTQDDAGSPAVNFSANVTTGYAPLAVGFTDNSTGSPTAWNWSFGDGNYSSSQNPAYLYSAAGSYTVTLQVNSPGGSNSTSRANFIVVNPPVPPVADFRTNVSSGMSPLAVQFTDNSTGGPVSWIWSFTNVTGNNTPVVFSSIQNPVQIFGGGNFSVSLNATNAYGSNSTPAFQYWVNVSTPAAAGKGYDSATTVMLHMNSSLTADDINATWWNFSPASSDNTTYKFGGSSGKFTTAGADIITNSRTPFNMGTGDFTVEGWVYFTSFTNTNNYFFSSGINSGTPANLFDVMYSTAQNGSWVFCDNGACNRFGDIPGNTRTGLWYAFAVSRVSGTVYFYVNGNLIGSRPDTTNIALGSNMMEIGSLSTTLGFVGYLDEVRVSKGLGRYSGSSYPLQTAEFGSSAGGGGTPPVAGFSQDLTSGTAPLAVTFTDTSSNNPTTWSWSFTNVTGNNTPVIFSSIQNPVQVFGSGNFSIRLTAGNSYGSDTTAANVHWVNASAVPTPLLSNFTANTTSGIAPLAVQFTDTSTGSPTSWNWSFGDGSFSAAQNPSSIYSTPGNYTVVLNVTNLYGVNSTTKFNYIAVSHGSPPTANFTANATSGIAPLAVQFTDTSTGSPTSWNWSFGDGNVSALRNPVHVYSFNGTFAVVLNATNAGGSNTSVTATTIVVSVPSPPLVSFDANATSGSVPLAVQFTDRSSGSPTSWNWSFGDGSLSFAQNPSHVYSAAGNFTVSLSAINGGGSNTTVRAGYIAVYLPNPPVASFSMTPVSGYAPLTVQFTDTSSSTPTSWSWSFTNITGNNTPVIFSVLENPAQIFGGGNFSIRLNATNSGGSNSTTAFQHWVNVSAPPAGGTGYDAATTVMLHMNSSPTIDDLHSTWVKDYYVTANSTISRFGGFSAQFTTAGYDMITNARSPYNMGTGDFTVEGWVYFTGFSNANNYFFGSGLSGGNPVNLFDIKYLTSPSRSWAFCDNGGCNNFGDVPGNTQTGQWYAFAVSRVSGVDYFYVNGNLIGSRPDTTNIALGGNMMEIGSMGTNFGFVGYLDEVRVSKGLGRYSGSSYPLQTAEFGSS